MAANTSTSPLHEVFWHFSSFKDDINADKHTCIKYDTLGISGWIVEVPQMYQI